MMTPEEVEQLCALCAEACVTETGKRLYAAIVTDGLFMRMIGADHPDPGSIADELGNDKIGDLAHQELEAMTDAERADIADWAADHLRWLVTGVSKGAFKAMRNGILDSGDLTPDFLINAAAVACVAQATK